MSEGILHDFLKKIRTFTAQSAVKVRIFCEYQLEKCI